jgi:hypothetical protein
MRFFHELGPLLGMISFKRTPKFISLGRKYEQWHVSFHGCSKLVIASNIASLEGKSMSNKLIELMEMNSHIGDVNWLYFFHGGRF